MNDLFFEELDKGFGDIYGPITEPGERLKALRVMIINIDNSIKAIESPDFIESLSAPDPEYRNNFRETIEQMDRLSERLLEGIRDPDSPVSPEDIDLGNPEEPIRDPLVRIAAFEALRFYIRFILEGIAEGEFLERIEAWDSTEFLERLRNTFLSLGLLVIRLSEGLEAEHE